MYLVNISEPWPGSVLTWAGYSELQ